MQEQSVVIAVGIKGANEEELMQIASGDDSTNVFNVQEFAALDAILEQITEAVCSASVNSGEVIPQ